MKSTDLVYINLLVVSTEEERLAFGNRVIEIAEYLSVDPNWLMICFYIESGMNPKAVNPVTYATGLIQWTPASAATLGTSCENIKLMTAKEQIEYVLEYLWSWRGRIKCFTDLYLLILYPAIIKHKWKGSKVVPPTVYMHNKGLDINTDPKITVEEIRQIALSKAPTTLLGLS
jgi:Transglycosylase SLT domain